MYFWPKILPFTGTSSLTHQAETQSVQSSSSSSSRMRVIYHNWSATKQRPHPQSVAEISRHSVLSGDRIRQCETSVQSFGHNTSTWPNQSTNQPTSDIATMCVTMSEQCIAVQITTQRTMSEARCFLVGKDRRWPAPAQQTLAVLWWAAQSRTCARRHWHQRVSLARLLRWQGSRGAGRHC